MMLRFRDYKKGDRLSHRNVNELNKAARIVEANGPLVRGKAGWVQHTFLVTEDPDSDDVAKGKIRYYDHSAEEWTEHEKEWDLDVGGLDLDVSSGDYLTAWWNNQRGMFVSIC